MSDTFGSHRMREIMPSFKKILQDDMWNRWRDLCYGMNIDPNYIMRMKGRHDVDHASNFFEFFSVDHPEIAVKYPYYDLISNFHNSLINNYLTGLAGQLEEAYDTGKLLAPFVSDGLPKFDRKNVDKMRMNLCINKQELFEKCFISGADQLILYKATVDSNTAITPRRMAEFPPIYHFRAFLNSETTFEQFGNFCRIVEASYLVSWIYDVLEKEKR